jgi:hypothetical protein
MFVNTVEENTFQKEGEYKNFVVKVVEVILIN